MIAIQSASHEWCGYGVSVVRNIDDPPQAVATVSLNQAHDNATVRIEASGSREQCGK